MLRRGGNVRHEHWEVDHHSVNATKGSVVIIFTTDEQVGCLQQHPNGSLTHVNFLVIANYTHSFRAMIYFSIYL